MKKTMTAFFNNLSIDRTSLKPTERCTAPYKAKYFYSGLLTLLIFSALNISGCSNKASTNPSVANISSSPTIAVQPSPSPAMTSLVTPQSTTLQVQATPSPSPVPVSLGVISTTSEELWQKGFDEYNQFNYDNAISYFDKAINDDSNNYKAYNSKGITLCFKGNYSEGMPLMQKSLDMKPDYAYGYFNMAMGYKLQKDYDSSLTYFNKALSLDPKDTWSYYGIATIYADRNDISTSLEYLKKAIDLDSAVKDVAREQDHFQPYLSNPEFQKLVG